MPDERQHAVQAVHNLKFVEALCEASGEVYLDWQITGCFYSALHLVNAHLAKSGLHFQSHRKVAEYVGHASKWPTALPANVYAAYKTLQSVSKISRYLVHISESRNPNPPGSLPVPRHLKKAILALETLFPFFEAALDLSVPPIKIQCSALSGGAKLKYFQIQPSSKAEA